MLLPHSKSLAATRLISTTGSPCRRQRRKLARRHQSLGGRRFLSISDFQSNQIAGRPDGRDAALISEGKCIQQLYSHDLFLRATVEACAANVAVLNETGEILYVSKPWRLSAEQYGPEGGRHPLDLNRLVRRSGASIEPSNHSSALAEDIKEILDFKITEFHNEYSCPSLSGSSCFVVHAARLDLPAAAGAFRVLVNCSDITHTRETEATLRDLGGRLITAQEEERSRVARELHDDLNQRMALLSIELEQIAEKMPASQSNLRLSMHNVWERAQEISSEIHRVSYQLHPSKLDHLGLVAAVKSLCLEVAARYEIKIDFKEEGCSGPLQKDVTLGLFRIVQESFRNITKHSGAREASVVLVGTPSVIQLSVSDNGRGFDVDSLESKSGLGLISMRERLRSIGGAISIHSTARGTKIEVSVPINGTGTRSAPARLPAAVNSSYRLLAT